jgi:hypothetical protein
MKYYIKPIRYPTLSSALTVTDATISLVSHPTISAYDVTSLTLKVLISDNWSSSLTFALVAQGNRWGLTAALALISLIIAWYAHNSADQVIKLTPASLEQETKGPTPIL